MCGLSDQHHNGSRHRSYSELGTPTAAGALSMLSSLPKKALKLQTARPALQTDKAMTFEQGKNRQPQTGAVYQLLALSCQQLPSAWRSRDTPDIHRCGPTRPFPGRTTHTSAMKEQITTLNRNRLVQNTLFPSLSKLEAADWKTATFLLICHASFLKASEHSI